MLFICGQSFISGGEQVLKILLQNSQNIGTKYLICKDDPKIRDFFTVPGTELLPFKYFTPLSDLKKKFSYAAYPIKLVCILLFALFLLRVVRKIKPRVIVSNNFSEIPFSILTYYLNIQFVQYVHEIIDDSGRVARVARTFQKFIVKFICVSKSAQYAMKNVLGVNKTVLLYNSTDILPVNRPKPLKADSMELVFIGMLNDNKNPMRFLRWLKLLNEQYSVSGKILYHMFDPALLGKAKAYCDDNRLVVGWVYDAGIEDVKKAIWEATYVCVPSQREALSLVALQAMALGTPVITSENGGVQELIVDGVNGFVVGTDDLAVVTKLGAFLNEESYQKLSKNCIQDARQFSHDAQASGFARILERL